MDNGAYSFLELRRNLQSPRPSTTFQSRLKSTGLDVLRPEGAPSTANAPAKSNPPLRKLNVDAENRKPLFNLLYGSQDKSKVGSQVASGTPQRKPSKQKGGLAEHFDDGRSSEVPQPRLDRFSSPLAMGCPPRSSTSTPFGKNGVDDATRHVFNSYITLKEETNQLKEQMESIQREYEEVVQDRDGVRSEFESLSTQLQEVSAQAADLRRTVTSYEAKLSESQRKAERADHSIGEAKDTIETLTFQLKEEGQEKERVRDDIQKLKRSLEDLRASSEKRASSYGELQERHQTLLSQLQDYGSFAKELKAFASDALEANKALLQPDGFLTAMRGSKLIIGELQAQLDSSKEVTNILRDKLHHLASVVAESRARIEELEEEKRTSLARLHEDYEVLKAGNQHSASLQNKVEDLTDRLVVREMETFDYLATAVATEERLEAANAELCRLRATISASEEELVSLHAMKEDHLNKLLAAQEVTNGKDKELSVVRSELKSMHESKAELRALWLEAKKTIAEKDEELLKRNPNPELETRVRELTAQLEAVQLESSNVHGKHEQAIAALNMASKAAEVAQTRCRELEKAAESQALSFEEVKLAHKIAYDVVMKERAAVEEKFQSHCAEAQNAAAEGRAISESLLEHQLCHLEEKLITAEAQLSSVKGDYQAWTAQSEKAKKELIERHKEDVCKKDEKYRKQEAAHAAQVAKLGKEIKALVDSQACQSRDATKYQFDAAEHKASIRELEMEKGNLIASLASLKQEQSQLLTLVAEERERQKEDLESRVNAQRRLVEAQEQRAQSTHIALEISQRELQRHQVQVSDLTVEVTRLKLDLEELQEKTLHKDERLSSLQDAVEVQGAQARIDALTAENTRLKDDARRLVERFDEGNLTDTEKALIRRVLSVAESVNEEDLVRKDHEIKSRDNQLQIMQQRIKGLEKTLAQVLRNQTVGTASNMVNLHSLMSSSPKDPLFVDAPKAPLNKPDSAQEGSMMVDQHPGSSSKLVHDERPSLAKLMESSDDEGPLAHLSSMSTLSNLSETKKKRARMSSPPPPPAPVSVQTKRRTKNAPATKRGARAAAGTNADRKTSEDVGRNRTLKRK